MDGLLNMVLKRILLGLVTLFLVALVVFFAVELRPGDYAEAFLMRWALPDTVAKYREILGLDQPAIFRFFQWLGRAMAGDLGLSFANGTPVFEMIWPRFKDTAFLAFYAAALAFPLSVALG